METTSNLTKVDMNWKHNFKNLGIQIHTELERQEFYPKLNIRQFKPESTHSLGYYTKLFRIKNIRGCILIWLDNYANHERPRISISYENKDLKSLIAIAKRLQNFDKILTLDETKIKPSKKGDWILQKPLANKHMDKFLIESYGTENYLTAILSDRLTKTISSKELISNITEYISLITRLIISIDLKKTANTKVSENNKKLSIHIKRERKMKFKDDAKFRDNYTCKICDFNVDRKYGKTAFAALEVHHIRPLSHATDVVETKLKDLITLCSNCHSMLHKLGGSKQQIARLKKIMHGTIKF